MGCKGNHQGQDNISRPSSQWDTTTTDGSEVARERSCHQIPEREEKEREREWRGATCCLWLRLSSPPRDATAREPVCPSLRLPVSVPQ